MLRHEKDGLTNKNISLRVQLSEYHPALRKISHGGTYIHKIKRLRQTGMYN